MSNLYAQAERRERVTQDVVDVGVHNNGVWLLDLVGTLLCALLWWR